MKVHPALVEFMVMVPQLLEAVQVDRKDIIDIKSPKLSVSECLPLGLPEVSLEVVFYQHLASVDHIIHHLGVEEFQLG